MAIRVGNVRAAIVSGPWGAGDKVFRVYIGRPQVFDDPFEHFGNPFGLALSAHVRVVLTTRQAVIEAFDAWLEGTAYAEIEPYRRRWILSQIELWAGRIALDGVNLELMCFCVPLVCHGDVLKRRIEARVEALRRAA